MVAAASRIRLLLGASADGEETRPYIIAATNDRAEECYLARLAERINQIWLRKRSASPPGIIASTYGDLDKLAQLGGDYHGFVAILASMMGRSVPKYMDEVVKFAKSHKLDKQTAVAVCGPVTAEAATRLGIPVTIMPREYTLDALVESIAQHFK